MPAAALRNQPVTVTIGQSTVTGPSMIQIRSDMQQLNSTGGGGEGSDTTTTNRTQRKPMSAAQRARRSVAAKAAAARRKSAATEKGKGKTHHAGSAA